MSNFRQRKLELHETLRKLLIRDFLNMKLTKHNKNVSRWKAQMRRFCDSAQHDDSPIMTDFTCMERKGLIAPGKYEELIAMFKNIDARAVDVILKTAAELAEIEKERKESRAMLKRFATLRSEINDCEVTEDQVKVLHDMLRQILQHSKASAHWESDLQEVPRHAGIPILRKRKSVADPEELRNSITEKGNFISKTHKMDWKAIIMMIKFVNTFSQITNYSLERVKPDGIYIAGYEDEPRRDNQNEIIRETFAELLLNVFATLGYDMQNASVITQMDFLEEETFSKALKQRLSSQPKSRQESAATNASFKKRAPVTPRQEPKHYDVMMSYQWGSKEMVHKVKNFLERNKITCWIDEESMKGSTLQAMAEAIEHSHIFLMCYSFKYFTSKNCRQEAEYANKLQKIIIPLKMQRDYEPRGWLGMILGEKLFYEFSGKYPFDQKAKELLTEILYHLQNPPEVTPPENDTNTETETENSETADISQNQQTHSRENSEKTDGERVALIGKIKKTKVKPGIKQITCREGLTWLGNGNQVLVSMDKEGKHKDTVCLGEGEIKYHTFTEEGELLFIYRNSLMKFVKRQLRPFIMYFSDGFMATCVACCVQTGDVFTGLQNKDKECSKVVRFSKIGKELKVYERDPKVGVLFESPVHLATLKNEDICICDSKKGVVIIDITGNHLFTYAIEKASGLTVDRADNILVCDGTETVHVITAEGQLLRKICVGRKGVAAMAVDRHSNLLIGFEKSSIVEVYRY